MSYRLNIWEIGGFFHTAGVLEGAAAGAPLLAAAAGGGTAFFFFAPGTFPRCSGLIVAGSTSPFISASSRSFAMMSGGWIMLKCPLASLPAFIVMSFEPPGWPLWKLDRSYTLPLSTSQQSSGLLCLATSSIENGMIATLRHSVEIQN